MAGHLESDLSGQVEPHTVNYYPLVRDKKQSPSH